MNNEYLVESYNLSRFDDRQNNDKDTLYWTYPKDGRRYSIDPTATIGGGLFPLLWVTARENNSPNGKIVMAYKRAFGGGDGMLVLSLEGASSYFAWLIHQEDDRPQKYYSAVDLGNSPFLPKEIRDANAAGARIPYFILQLEGESGCPVPRWANLRVAVLKQFKSVPQNPTISHVEFQESYEDFPNPERGFSRWGGLGTTSNYTSLSQSILSSFRSAQTPPANPDPANYQVVSTLVYRPIVLDIDNYSGENYLDRDSISASFQRNELEADFAAARNAGVKLILRFTYGYNYNLRTCSEHQDPPLERILSQIESLKDTLNDQKSAIALIQLGFIGNFGEGYWTGSNEFGCRRDGQSRENWENRIAVLNKLLEVAPEDRIIQVRAVQMKQKFLFGPSAPTTSTSNTRGPNNGTLDSRIGFYNDCFLATFNDQGTYANYDGIPPNSTPQDVANLRSYLEADSRYIPVGGETCQLNDPHHRCNDCGGQAIAELARFHYSHLNADYNTAVINDWVACGCMEEIKLRLGYRFVLREGVFTTGEIVKGSTIFFLIRLQNAGFASPYNSRRVELILQNELDPSIEFVAELPLDPRTWYSNQQISFNFKLLIPTTMPSGAYGYYLNLPDSDPSLRRDSNYSIRLANANVVFTNKGYNELGKTIIVQEGTPVTPASYDLELQRR